VGTCQAGMRYLEAERGPKAGFDSDLEESEVRKSHSVPFQPDAYKLALSRHLGTTLKLRICLSWSTLYTNKI